MSHAMRGAVLGHPIGHSKSPALHSAAYAALGIDYQYEAIDLQETDLAAFLEHVRQENNWYGLSVTMPLKNEAAALADELTPAAKALGAANTLSVTRRGPRAPWLVGENTDVAGIRNALRYGGVRSNPRAAILGGGGTAVAAVAALQQLQAVGIEVFVRDQAKAAASTQEVAQGFGLALTVRDYKDAAQSLGEFDIVISTLPPHAADQLASELLRNLADVSGACLLDVAYDPWPSALAQAWEAHGGNVVPGIEMLLYQGLEQVKLFATAGGFQERLVGQEATLLDVMCDALGLPRRPPLG